MSNMMKKLRGRSDDGGSETASSSAASSYSYNRRLFSLTLIYVRGKRSTKTTVQINPEITFRELKVMVASAFGINDVSDLRLSASAGMMQGRKKEIKRDDDERIYVALNDNDTVYVERKQKKSPSKGGSHSGDSSGLVPAVTGFGQNVKVIVRQVPTGGHHSAGDDGVEGMDYEYEVSDMRDATHSTTHTVYVDADEIPPELMNNGIPSSDFAMDLHHTSGGHQGGRVGGYHDDPGHGRRRGEDDAAFARRLQAEEYGVRGRGGRGTVRNEQTHNPRRTQEQCSADRRIAQQMYEEEARRAQKTQWKLPGASFFRSSTPPSSSSSQQERPRHRPSPRPPPRSEPKIVPDPGSVVLRGTTSQYTLSPGGESACTSICLFAAREFLSFNTDNNDSSLDLAYLGASGLDCVVRRGIDAHQSLGSMHASIDELWSLSAFENVVCTLAHGAPFGGMVNSRENGFKQGLQGALEFARNQHQEMSSSSSLPSASARRVAVLITKPPETILCIAASCNGEGGTWYIFDSHGESNAATKLVYLKRYDSIDAVVQGLMHKFPGACVAEMGGGLQAEMYNSFEATPIVYQPGGGSRTGREGEGATSMARAMEASQRESSHNNCSGSSAVSSSLSTGRGGDLERAMEESRREYQQQEATVSQPPRGDELERALEEPTRLEATRADLRTQSAPAASQSSHNKMSGAYSRPDQTPVCGGPNQNDSQSPTRLPNRDSNRGKHQNGGSPVSRASLTRPSGSVRSASHHDDANLPKANDDLQDDCHSTKKSQGGGKGLTELSGSSELRDSCYQVKKKSNREGHQKSRHLTGPASSSNGNQVDDEFEENRGKPTKEGAHGDRYPTKKPDRGGHYSSDKPGSDEKASNDNSYDSRYPTKKPSRDGHNPTNKSRCDESQGSHYPMKKDSNDYSHDGRYPTKKKSSCSGIDRTCAPMGANAIQDASVSVPTCPPSEACESDATPKKGKLLASGSCKMDKDKKKLHIKISNKIKRKSKKQFDEVSAPSAPPVAEPEPQPQPKKEPINDSFLDPITYEVMADPVICEDGFTYDRTTIEQHFKSRIEQEKRRRREEEGDQAPADNAACCGARREIQLTSPKTGQVVKGVLLPNRTLEHHIVELIEGDRLDMSKEDIADWKDRRKEKRRGDRRREKEERQERERQEERRRNMEEAMHRRREEEAQGGGQPAAPAAAPFEEQRPLAEQVRVDRMVFNGLDNLSEHDLGLSVTFCDDTERCFPDYASSVSVGNVPRCMVACCAKRLGSDYHWCARCGRLACLSCLEFHVTDYTNKSTESRSICGECVTQIVDVMDPSGTEGQARAFIANVSLRHHNSNLTNQAIALQDQRVKINAENQFGPGIRQLEEEVRELEHTRDQIQAQIRDAETRARNARNNDGSSTVNSNRAESDNGSRSIAEWEETCLDLQRQYNDLLQRQVPYHDEEAQIMHFTAISDVESRLEQAQMTLSEMQSRSTGNGRRRSPTVGPAGGESVEELEALCEHLQREYAALARTNVPGDEFSQIRHIEAVSEVTARLDEAQMKLSELRSDEKNAASDIVSSASSNEFSVSGKSVSELEELFANLQREYDGMISQGTPTDEASQFAHFGAISLITDRLEKVQMSLVEARARGVSPTATNLGTSSNYDGTDDPVLLDAIGSRDNEWPLPLGLSYPTTRMENQLELLKNALAQQLSSSERKYDDEYGERRRALTAQRDRLEDEIQRAKVEAQDAEASAEAEQERLQEREERRRREEEERRERERVRLERERRARAEAEQLRQKHASDEDATRAAFANVARGQGGAAAFGGRGDFRMCRRCKAGPIENIACSDLAAHNDTSTTYKGNAVASRERPNDCPHCGWFDADWNNWPLWDGITGPH